MVSRGDASRYDVACRIVELLKLDIKINKVDSDFFKEDYFAPRPASERLLNQRLDSLKLNYMNEWNFSLEHYLKEFYE